MEIKKNPKSNLENFSKVFMLLGLVLALFVVYVAIEHKTYDRIVEELEHISLEVEDVEDMILTQIKPPSAPPPPPPPPPPPTPEQFEKVEDDVEIEEVVIETTEAEVDDVVEIDDVVYVDEVEEVTYEDVPFATVSNPPVFPGCEKKTDKRKCFNNKIKKFIGNLDVNEMAEELGLSGRIRYFVAFKVNEFGRVDNINVIRAPHPEIEKATKEVFKKIPQMAPASQNGKKVRIPYTVPIVFDIQ